MTGTKHGLLAQTNKQTINQSKYFISTTNKQSINQNKQQ